MGLGVNGVASLVGTERRSLNGLHTEWEKSQASGVSAAKTHQAPATSSLNRSPRTVIMRELGLLVGSRHLRQYSSLRVRHATERHRADQGRHHSGIGEMNLETESSPHET